MEDEWMEAGTELHVVVSVCTSIVLEVGKVSQIEGLVVYEFSSA